MDNGALGTSGERQTQVDQAQVYSRASRLKNNVKLQQRYFGHLRSVRSLPVPEYLATFGLDANTR
jgi:hypothetical protein